MRKPKLDILTVFVLLLASCVKPMYDVAPEAYKEHKYWERGQNEWFPKGGFDILIAKTFNDGIWTLNLSSYKQGMPSVRDGALQAARDAGFEIMAELCGVQSFTALPGKSGLQRFDRFFYRNNDMSLTVSFFCHGDKNPTLDALGTEQLKWTSATEKWRKIKGKNAQILSLPPMRSGVRQIKIRIFDADDNLSRRLAREIMSEDCNSPSFELLNEKPSFTITPRGRPPAVIEDKNIRIYTFRCFGPEG